MGEPINGTDSFKFQFYLESSLYVSFVACRVCIVCEIVMKDKSLPQFARVVKTKLLCSRSRTQNSREQQTQTTIQYQVDKQLYEIVPKSIKNKENPKP